MNKSARPPVLLSVHFSRFDMLTPRSKYPFPSRAWQQATEKPCYAKFLLVGWGVDSLLSVKIVN